MAKIIFDSEKELEDYICTTIDQHQICPISDEHVDKYYRQLDLGKYGIADIVKIEFGPCRYGEMVITVLELKKEKINIESVAQVCRYMSGIKYFIKKEYPDTEIIRVCGELAAPNISMNSDFVYLQNFIPDVDVYTISCDLEVGFSAENISKWWHKTDEDLRCIKQKVNEIKRISISKAKYYRDCMRLEDRKNVVSIKEK